MVVGVRRWGEVRSRGGRTVRCPTTGSLLYSTHDLTCLEQNYRPYAHITKDGTHTHTHSHVFLPPLTSPTRHSFLASTFQKKKAICDRLVKKGEGKEEGGGRQEMKGNQNCNQDANLSVHRSGAVTVGLTC